MGNYVFLRTGSFFHSVVASCHSNEQKSAKYKFGKLELDETYSLTKEHVLIFRTGSCF